MDETTTKLENNNTQILNYIQQLNEQRNEINLIIEKQEKEKNLLINEIDRLKYKLAVTIKSLNERTKIRDRYNATITEIDKKYGNLIAISDDILSVVRENASILEYVIDKNTSTTDEVVTIHQPSRTISDYQSNASGEGLLAVDAVTIENDIKSLILRGLN